MSGLDDRLRQTVDRLSGAVQPGEFNRIRTRRARLGLVHRLQVASLAVVVLAATAGGGYALTRAFRRDAPDVASAPTVRNGKIAFVRGQNRSSRGMRFPDIFVMDSDGANLNPLSDDDASEWSLDWSPDGTRLAFVRDDDIYVMNADGSGLTALTSNEEGQNDSPDWSPDGTRIAFTRSDLTYCEGCPPNPPSEKVLPHLHVMNADGSGVRALASGPWSDHDPTWSPDGSTIAFVRSEPITMGPPPLDLRDDVILAVAPDGSNLRELATVDRMTQGAAQGLEWSPDGKRFLFSSERIYTMNVDGTGVESLPVLGPTPRPLSFDATWSPDGTKIALAFDSGISLDIYVMNADGTGLTELTSGPEDDFAPAWQPLPTAGPVPTSPAPTQVSPSLVEKVEPGPLEEFESRFGPLCGTAVGGDFDGNGQLDLAAAAFPLSGETCPVDPGDQSWSLYAIWNDTAAGAWALPECTLTCRAFAARDLDGDGADVLFLVADSGASTEFLRVYELPLRETGPIRFELAGGEPLVLEYGGSATHQALVTCEIDPAQRHLNGLLIASTADLSPDQSTWMVHETVFLVAFRAIPPLDVGEDVRHRVVTVVSSRDYTVPFDPTGEQPLPVPGEPCWVVD